MRVDIVSRFSVQYSIIPQILEDDLNLIHTTIEKVEEVCRSSRKTPRFD